MPKGVDEKAWNQAKASAREQGKPENWRYVTGIYKKIMQNRKAATKTAVLSIVANYWRNLWK